MIAVVMTEPPECDGTKTAGPEHRWAERPRYNEGTFSKYEDLFRYVAALFEVPCPSGIFDPIDREAMDSCFCVPLRLEEPCC